MKGEIMSDVKWYIIENHTAIGHSSYGCPVYFSDEPARVSFTGETQFYGLNWLLRYVKTLAGSVRGKFTQVSFFQRRPATSMEGFAGNLR